MADGGGATSTGGGGGGGGDNSSQRQPRRGGGEGGGRDGGGRGRGRGGGRGRGEGGGRGGGGRGGGRGGDSSQQHGPSDGQRRRGGGGGRGGRHGGGDHRRHASGDAAEDKDKAADKADGAPQQSRKDPLLRPPQPAGEAGSGGEDRAADDDAEVCFICANPVIHHAIAPCNHLTCHICALRMRALYRTKDCPHCRTPAPYVIFTDDPARRFEDYTDADISSTDDNIGIKYTNEDIVGDTVLLLRYNCPDEICDYAGFGWPDLHRHVRSTHHKKMCDLCTRNKKVFTHEHELFSEKAHEKHMRHGDDKPGAVDQTGFRGHPLCGFCGERFYDDDKLYEHCRNKHERCFICDRRDSRQPHYYRNYNELEKHFKKDHYICSDRECLEKKFVVFEAELDLKAHQLSEHGNTLSKDVRRDVQVVSMADFDFRGGEGRGGHGGGGGGRNHQGRASRGRDPNADAPIATSSSSQNMRRDEIAYQRQMAIHSAQSISNRTFGSHLSSPAPTPAQASRQASPANANAAPRNPPPQNSSSSTPSADQLIDPMSAMSASDLANLSPADRARLVRHGAVIERASNLLGSNPAKVNAFRYNISSYRSGARSATQLIDAFSTLFSETSDTALGSLVREVADLFDDAGKADALRKALHDRRAAAGGAEGSVQEDYPSLPTLGGMHGATTSTSGWAAAASANAPSAANHTTSSPSTRVLRLKHSTRLGGPSTSSSSVVNSTPSSRDPNGRSVPGATWTAPPSSLRPAAVAPRAQQPASAAFPALPSAAAGNKKGPSSSWVNVSGGAGASTLASRVGSGIGGSSNSAGRYASLSSVPASGSSTPPISSGRDAFPALPAAPKPPPPSVFGYGRKAVRRDLGGGNQETGFSWGGEGEGSSSAAAAAPAEAEDESGKGKKKGRAGKKVLVQWG